MVPYDEATVHVLTHSLHYGLAVFEGMRCYKSDDGRSAIFRAREHIRRLIESGHIVEMEVPYSAEELLKACADVVRINKFAECYIRPLVFFGEGEMGLSARGNKIRVSIAAWPWGAYLGQDSIDKGVRLEDVVIRAIPSQLDDAGGESDRPLRQLDPRRLRGPSQRLR